MKIVASIFIFLISAFVSFAQEPDMKIDLSYSVDSLGACQGISYQKGRIFLYGDREVGVIKEYKRNGDHLTPVNNEMKLTLNGADVINHPTGMAVHRKCPIFIGNSILLNNKGDWKAVIYCVDWKGLQRTGTLDNNLANIIDDDTCIQGTRPEYVRYKKKWYVATADYGIKGNEVRLYDPALLKKAKKTSDSGVLYKKFICSPLVQNLYWMKKKGILVLIQNATEGRGWRFTYVDLKRSIEDGKQKVIKVIDIDRKDELEGFSFLNDYKKGIAVSSALKDNVIVITQKGL